jgi:hypothetical protein
MDALDPLVARRAIESLRNGVPSGAAVRALGWESHSQIRRFDTLLADARSDSPGKRGALVVGEFGTGKSHLLGFLEQRALEANFVVSRVVISKETPLFQPERVLAAALRDGRVPGARGAVLHELAPRLDFRARTADGLARWGASAPGMLAASLHLYERSVELADDELLARVVDWWAGEKLAPTEVKAGLRRLGSQQAFDVKAIKAVDLLPKRIELVANVIKAVGFAGWLILLDEVELIGRYSRLQRAKSYAELARWFGDGTSALPSLACIATVTGDFGTKVLDGGEAGLDDRQRVPRFIRGRGKPGDTEFADGAEAGIAILDDHEAMFLSGPDRSSLDATKQRVAEVYGTAFGWTPPSGSATLMSTTTPMRTYIKTWIYAWDLDRLGITQRPSIQAETLTQSYEQDDALESVPEADEE